jgi:hypothetical protein
MEYSYQQLEDLYSKYFSFGNLGISFDSKLALLSMLCHLTEELKGKKPDINHYQVLRNIVGTKIPDNVVKGISIVAKDMSYGCQQFPTFGLTNKQMIDKIKELADNYLPF